MNLQQQEEELWTFQTFVKLYPGGPITAFTKHESPDFIVEIEGKRIGIELTEIFQDSTGSHSKLQQRSSDWENFTNQFIRELQPFVEFTFAIGIHFTESHPIRKARKTKIIEQLISVCVPKLLGLSNRQNVEFDYFDNLPEEIHSIYITRFDGMEASFNYKSEGGSVATLSVEHLLPVLANKEAKLKNYLGCDEYWLVIREGNYYAGSFSDNQPDISVKSSFDQVFLLRTKLNRLIPLK